MHIKSGYGPGIAGNQLAQFKGEPGHVIFRNAAIGQYLYSQMKRLWTYTF